MIYSTGEHRINNILTYHVTYLRHLHFDENSRRRILSHCSNGYADELPKQYMKHFFFVWTVY